MQLKAEQALKERQATPLRDLIRQQSQAMRPIHSVSSLLPRTEPRGELRGDRAMPQDARCQ